MGRQKRVSSDGNVKKFESPPSSAVLPNDVPGCSVPSSSSRYPTRFSKRIAQRCQLSHQLHSSCRCRKKTCICGKLAISSSGKDVASDDDGIQGLKVIPLATVHDTISEPDESVISSVKMNNLPGTVDSIVQKNERINTTLAGSNGSRIHECSIDIRDTSIQSNCAVENEINVASAIKAAVNPNDSVNAGSTKLSSTLPSLLASSIGSPSNGSNGASDTPSKLLDINELTSLHQNTFADASDLVFVPCSIASCSRKRARIKVEPKRAKKLTKKRSVAMNAFAKDASYLYDADSLGEDYFQSAAYFRSDAYKNKPTTDSDSEFSVNGGSLRDLLSDFEREHPTASEESIDRGKRLNSPVALSDIASDDDDQSTNDDPLEISTPRQIYPKGYLRKMCRENNALTQFTRQSQIKKTVAKSGKSDAQILTETLSTVDNIKKSIYKKPNEDSE